MNLDISIILNNMKAQNFWISIRITVLFRKVLMVGKVLLLKLELLKIEF